MINTRRNIFLGFLLIAISAAQFSCGTLQNIEFDRNRTLWNESKITDYKMTIKIQKTGHATPNGKFIIIVRNGVAESIKMFDKPDSNILKDSVIRFGRYSTIEGIFSFIENAENDKAQNSRSWSRRIIEYDAKFGYPKKVDLDQSGVLDDELYFEVLDFEIEESPGDKVSAKPSPSKVISVSATEITKAEKSVRSHDGYDWGGISFSKDGTAFRSYRAMNYDTSDNKSNKSTELKKYQGVASQEQFQNLAQTIADNDFSNLRDTTERSPDQTDYVLTITYAGKTKSIKMNLTGKDIAEIEAILSAFEKLKNQIDWTEIK